MITLEDRLRATADDLRQAASRVPARGHLAALTRPPRARWPVAVLVVAALVALPLWLGAFDAFREGPPPGIGSESDLEIIMRRGADAIAFLDNSVTLDEALNLVEKIRRWEDVDRVAYVSQERALIEFRELFADQESLMQVVEEDPSVLPASIRLLLTDGADAEEIGARLQRIPGVVRASPGEDIGTAVPDEGSGEGSTSADPESREPGGAGAPGIIADLHGWVSHEEAIRLTEEVRSWDGVVDATLVTREAAENEMRSMITVITTVSGFTDTEAETSSLHLLSIRIVMADPPRSTPWLAVTDRLSAGGNGLVSHLWEVFPQDES